jgi:hypothetical protein
VLDGPLPLDLASIDNLPSVLAREASAAFADLLLPALLEYPGGEGWAKARRVFEQKLALLEESDQGHVAAAAAAAAAGVTTD